MARGKPAPDIFLAAAREVDVAPSNRLVLEDSSAGMRPIMIPDLLQPDDAALAAGVPLRHGPHRIAELFAAQVSTTRPA